MYVEHNIWMADDDPDDLLLVSEAFATLGAETQVIGVGDGQALLDRLAAVMEGGDVPPDLVLLDLNMPGKTGCEVLAQIKTDARFRQIPVVVFTSSGLDVDVVRCYAGGANSFVRKPRTFDGFVEFCRMVQKYWFGIVELPTGR